MKAAAPAEFRIAGKARGAPRWAVSVGAEVPEAAAKALSDLFFSPRYSILNAMERGTPPEPAVLDELATRGYSPASIRLSVFLKGHGTPRKPRVLPMLPGRLLLRWGWVDYDHTPDVTGTWGFPARKGDLNLLFGMLCSHTSPVPLEAHDYPRMPRPLDRLANLGWDLRTLDFRASMAVGSGAASK